jgi:hypothetical protein
MAEIEHEEAMTKTEYDDDDMLTPSEVAAKFRVDPKTTTRWALAGRIPDLPGEPRSVIRTPGGHRRFRYKVIRMILSGEIEMSYGDDPVSIPATPVVRP